MFKFISYLIAKFLKRSNLADAYIEHVIMRKRIKVTDEISNLQKEQEKNIFDHGNIWEKTAHNSFILLKIKLLELELNILVALVVLNE